MLVMSSDYRLYTDTPLDYARIMWDSLHREGSWTASGYEDGYAVSALKNDLTSRRWKPDVLPAWAQVTFDASQDVDCICIAAHTLGDHSASIKPQYSTDSGVTWTDAASEVAPADNRPLMWLFDAVLAPLWRLYLSGTTAPTVGVCFIGKALAMPRGIYGGHSPQALSRVVDTIPTVSESGEFLGKVRVRRGTTGKYDWKNLPAGWYREKFDPFVQSLQLYPCFIAWRPATYPDEVEYAWSDKGEVTPVNSTAGKSLMDVSLTLQGYDQA